MDTPEVQGFEVAAIVVGVVQFIKEQFELGGKPAQGVALLVGLLLFGYWSAMQAGVVPEEIVVWANVVIRAIGYTLAVPGLFKIVKHEFLGR